MRHLKGRNQDINKRLGSSNKQTLDPTQNFLKFQVLTLPGLSLFFGHLGLRGGIYVPDFSFVYNFFCNYFFSKITTRRIIIWGLELF